MIYHFQHVENLLCLERNSEIHKYSAGSVAHLQSVFRKVSWIFRLMETACPEDWKPRVRRIGNRFQHMVRKALGAEHLLCSAHAERCLAHLPVFPRVTSNCTAYGSHFLKIYKWVVPGAARAAPACPRRQARKGGRRQVPTSLSTDGVTSAGDVQLPAWDHSLTEGSRPYTSLMER